MTCTNVLSPKSPLETVTLTFDFSTGLESGEILTSFISRSVSVIAGVDADPSLMWNGDQEVNVQNTMVQQSVQGGLDACYYQFTMLFNTSIGRKLVVSAVLPVLQ
jgi:hypothetical protein